MDHFSRPQRTDELLIDQLVAVEDHVRRHLASGNVTVNELLAHLTESLRGIEGLRIIGSAPEKAAVVSFLLEGAHAHDLATLLDLEGVAVRSGFQSGRARILPQGIALDTKSPTRRPPGHVSGQVYR